MAGVLFMACIPTQAQEQSLNQSLHVDETMLLSQSAPSARLEVVSETERRKRTASEGEESKESWLHELRSPLGKKLQKKKLEVKSESSMEKILSEVLTSLKIENYSWVPIQNGKFVHVIFCVDADTDWEEVLKTLTKWGIGNRHKSTLGVIPCTMFFKADESECSDDEDDAKSKSKLNSSKSGWNEFVLSVVRSRLAVAQVVESVKGDAKLTFDFVCLIILAGTISAMGLVENSVVSIVASMLISPLMGPILAGTFGTVISDRKLQLMGVRNELIGLALTILVGYTIGLIIGGVDDYYGTNQWPTSEMMSRGLLRSLWVGVLIALPSGAGVALGLLGDNSGSLIGVAISASLLPPAVNAGLLWALATLEGILGRSEDREVLKGLFAEKVYSNHLPTEYALLGCVSLSLTLVNIICIFISGIVVLKIKEVAPRALTDDVQQFWHHDIKVARDYNRSLNKEDARFFENQLTEELGVFASDEPLAPPMNGEDFLRQRMSSTLLRRMSGPRRLSQVTWSPSVNLEHRRSSLRDLENLYASLGGNEPPRLSMGGHWKAGNLTPIMEGAGLERQSSSHRRRSRRHTWSRSNRFTVIPTTSQDNPTP